MADEKSLGPFISTVDPPPPVTPPFPTRRSSDLPRSSVPPRTWIVPLLVTGSCKPAPPPPVLTTVPKLRNEEPPRSTRPPLGITRLAAVLLAEPLLKTTPLTRKRTSCSTTAAPAL